MTHKDLRNLNGDLLCSLAIVTTGKDPLENDILSLGLIPLNSEITASTKYLPQAVEIRPRFPENGKSPNGARSIKDFLKFGIDHFDAAERLLRLFSSGLDLQEGKRIQPIVHDWGSMRPHLEELFGPLNFEYYFSDRVRDIKTIALAINDRAAFRAKAFPFPKVKLSYLLSQLNIPHALKVDGLSRALYTAEVYKRIMSLDI